MYSLNSCPLTAYRTIMFKVLTEYSQDSLICIIDGGAHLCTLGLDGELDFHKFKNLEISTYSMTGDCSAIQCKDGVLWVKCSELQRGEPWDNY